MADKNTHVAVHAIYANDAQGKPITIEPGTAFAPNKADLAHLENAGAIRKLEKAAAVEEDGEGEGEKGGKK